MLVAYKVSKGYVCLQCAATCTMDSDREPIFTAELSKPTKCLHCKTNLLEIQPKKDNNEVRAEDGTIIKRGRGRPPKNPKPQTEDKPKKPRGRPRKTPKD